MTEIENERKASKPGYDQNIQQLRRNVRKIN